MAGYYNRRKSKAASWCLRFSVLAIPYFLLTVFFHRSGSIDSEQLFWLFAFGIAMLITSILCGIWAAVDLWEKGSKGGRMTVNGIILATLLLAPFGYQFVKALNNPELNDLATDVLNPPHFINTFIVGEKDNEYEAHQARIIVSSYPDVVSRHYLLPTSRVSQVVEGTLKKLGWKVVASKNIPQKPTLQDSELVDEKTESKKETKKLAKKPKNKKSKKVVEVEEDIEEEKEIIFQTKIKSFIIKLESDVVIRLSPNGDETQVDLRASSQWGAHDFGNNAKYISKFFAALDVAMVGVTVEN